MGSDVIPIDAAVMTGALVVGVRDASSNVTVVAELPGTTGEVTARWLAATTVTMNPLRSR